VPLFSNLFGGDAGPELKVSVAAGADATDDGAAIDASPDDPEFVPIEDGPFLQHVDGDAGADRAARADAEIGSIISSMTDLTADDFGLLL
jgi:hypothetical protein